MGSVKTKKLSGDCSACSFWESQDKQVGECRRFPPVLIYSVPGSHLLPDGRIGIFPSTLPTTTCGEFNFLTPL
jgi:hypothetical protein